MNARTRSDMIEISYTPIGGDRTRLRFEPSDETTRWALCESRWNSATGKWRPIGTVPVRNLTLDAGRSRGDQQMKPDTLNSRDVWNRIDDVGYTHHVIIWMIILELETEGTYPVNIPVIQRRMFRWTGEYPKKNRVNRSIERLDQHGLIEREEIDEWPGGKHNTITAEGLEIARQITLKRLQLLDCEGRQDLHEIDPEAEATGDG